MPVCCRQATMRAGGRPMFTPSASITSAEPHLELMLRLPCLATRTPAPAMASAVAVEMLKVPLVSPPVPQVSTSASRSVPLRSSDSPSSVVKHRGLSADGLREADDLLHRLALHMQRDQQRANLGVGALAAENLRHHLARLVAGEGRAVIGDFVQCVEDHGAIVRVAFEQSAIGSQRLASRLTWMTLGSLLTDDRTLMCHPERRIAAFAIPSRRAPICR